MNITRRHFCLWACLALLFSAGLAYGADDKIIIIKADDMTGEHAENWKKFFAVADEKGIKVSVGIICNSLETDKNGYFDWLKGLAASGKVEFWNHGWDHKQWTEGSNKISEFNKSGYDHQKQAIDKSQEVTTKALGEPLHTFGAPFNAVDADTAKVISEHPEIRMAFVYGKPAGYDGKVLLPMAIRGEVDGAGKPNFEKFRTEYAKTKNAKVAAIQFHPPYFSEDGVKQFAQIIDFLKAEGWTFMLPSEYEKVAGAK